MNKFDNQISRMKAMMNYGLQTESKPAYSAIEYNRTGADGKMYGIVREGAKYYIKVSDKTDNVLKENFEYIGGFRNRKDYEYSSYANALKQFELKMRSINEAVNKKDSIVIDSWNPERKEMLTVESTNKMKQEIARQRQIMGNVVLIQEKKNYNVDLTEAECCKVEKECADTQKNNIKKQSDGKGEPTGNGGDPFTEKVCADAASTQKTNGKKECKPVMESEEVLAWNDNEEYLDQSHGTEVGDDAPFTEEVESIEECDAIHNCDDQNKPKVGVGEVDTDYVVEEGFFHNDAVSDDEQLEDTPEEIQLESEEIDVEDDDIEDEDIEGDVDMETEIDSDDVDFESDLEDIADEVEKEDEFDDDMETRLSAMEDLLAKIAEKIGVNTFDDDTLYSDDEDTDVEDNVEELADNEDEEDDFEVFESKNYRKAMLKEDDLHYFGKHPAYQKEPMELNSSEHQEKEGYYDMNDETAKNTEEYGKEIGDGAPFEIEPNQIANAIAESIKQILKKKI